MVLRHLMRIDLMALCQPPKRRVLCERWFLFLLCSCPMGQGRDQPGLLCRARPNKPTFQLRRTNVPQKSAFSICSLIVLITTLLVGCQSPKLPTTTPDYKVIQTQVIPRETVTASYYHTKAAQFLAQVTADPTGGSSRSEDFPYAPCVISALVIAVMVGIYARSRRKK